VQSKDDPIRRGVDRLGQRWGSNTASDPTKNSARELLAFPRGRERGAGDRLNWATGAAMAPNDRK